MTRSLGFLYAVGALVGLAYVALSRGTPGAAVVVPVVVAGAILLGGLCLALGAGAALPTWTLHPMFVLVQVALGVFFVSQQDPTSDARLSLLWAGALAAAFLRPRFVVAHVAFSLLVVLVCLRLVEGPLLVDLRSGMTIGAVLVLVASVVSTVSGGMHRAQGRLLAQAERDELTGTANRRGLRSGLEAALAGPATRETHVALFDLEGFTYVNETYGLQVGDELLVHVARRLQEVVGEDALVARTAGDELAVLLLVAAPARRRPAEADDRVDDLLRRALEAVHTPAVLPSATVLPRARVGVTSSRASGRSADDVLRDVDLALRQAKDAGRGALVRFDDGIRSQAEQERRMEQLLSEALAGSLLTTVHQPVVDIERDEVVGTEVLVRWSCPELGNVPPSVFVPLAERRGLIVPLGAWVLRESVVQLALWRAAGLAGPGFRVAVNVSARQLQDGFDAEVLAVLREHDVPGDGLVLEVTETSLLERPEVAARVLQPLREQGVHVALDDFGTGYSSLSSLLGVAADVLKVDRSFVGQLSAETVVGPDAAAAGVVVSAVVGMAHGLHLGVVAEGVETTEQLDELRRIGVRHVQGYLLARPGPAAETTRLLEAARSARPGPVASLPTRGARAVAARPVGTAGPPGTAAALAGPPGTAVPLVGPQDGRREEAVPS